MTIIQFSQHGHGYQCAGDASSEGVSNHGIGPFLLIDPNPSNNCFEGYFVLLSMGMQVRV